MIESELEPRPIELGEAIDRTKGETRHLLLGNGFSISARQSFAYRSLFQRAGPFSPHVAALFRERQTEDFEEILAVLGGKLKDASIAAADRAKLQRQETEVRDQFVQALSHVHPDSAMRMNDDECHSCASFLELFVGRQRPERVRGRIYTTNYDLLLYWVIARHGRRLWCYDSHISPVDDKRYGLWDPEKPPGLVYLHGALHLYERTQGQLMLRYSGQRSLMEQTRKLLDQNRFPLMVSEGTSEAKLERIGRSPYLTWSRRWLRSGLRNTNGALFTFGHSLSRRDEHLVSRIGEGGIRAVYLGMWKGLAGGNVALIQGWAEQWAASRRGQPMSRPLEIRVFDTSEFSPWTSSVAQTAA